MGNSSFEHDFYKNLIEKWNNYKRDNPQVVEIDFEDSRVYDGYLRNRKHKGGIETRKRIEDILRDLKAKHNSFVKRKKTKVGFPSFRRISGYDKEVFAGVYIGLNASYRVGFVVRSDERSDLCNVEFCGISFKAKLTKDQVLELVEYCNDATKILIDDFTFVDRKELEGIFSEILNFKSSRRKIVKKSPIVINGESFKQLIIEGNKLEYDLYNEFRRLFVKVLAGRKIKQYGYTLNEELNKIKFSDFVYSVYSLFKYRVLLGAGEVDKFDRFRLFIDFIYKSSKSKRLKQLVTTENYLGDYGKRQEAKEIISKMSDLFKRDYGDSVVYRKLEQKWDIDFLEMFKEKVSNEKNS